MIKHIFLLTAFLTLTSCGSHYRAPESVESKIERFQANREYGNTIPQIEISPLLLTQKTQAQGRMPASIETPNPAVLKTLQHLSNKRVYFSTLFAQFEEMRAYVSEQVRPLAHCPQFHSVMLDLNKTSSSVLGKKIFDVQYDLNKLDDADYLAAHTELFLPVTTEYQIPRVIDVYRQQGGKLQDLVLSALTIHINKTAKELYYLCEHGNSENYYSFENLAGMKDLDLNKKTLGSMKTLLKTTVFSNMVILKSLDKLRPAGRTVASVPTYHLNAYHLELIRRFQSQWFTDYLDALSFAK